MPPRIPLRLPQILPFSPLDSSLAVSSKTSIPSFLLPFLHTQSRNASILSSLSDRPGAYNRRIRRGRGPASGNGGKSGRGSDGQKQHGKVPAGFNGGQTPEHIVHGKYGFKNLSVFHDVSSRSWEFDLLTVRRKTRDRNGARQS